MSNLLPKFKNQAKLDSEAVADPKDIALVKQGWFYNTLNDILSLNKKKMVWGAKTLVVFDAPNVWKREMFPQYKSNRRKKNKTSTPFDKLHQKLLYEFIDELDEVLKMMRIQTWHHRTVTYNDKEFGCEADDVIGVICMNGDINDKHLIMSNDGDFKILTNHHVRIYDKNSRKVLDPMPHTHKQKYKITTCLKGQAKDGVPSIKFETKLADDFIDFLEEDISPDDTHLFEDLQTKPASKELVDTFIKMKTEKIEALIKEGKRKQLGTISIYAPGDFGDVAVEKFYNSDWKEVLKSERKWARNFKRNCDLILFERIPREIQDDILEQVEDIFTVKKRKILNTIKVQRWLSEHSVPNCSDLIS